VEVAPEALLRMSQKDQKATTAAGWAGLELAGLLHSCLKRCRTVGAAGPLALQRALFSASALGPG
jgi:hypothetical protein